MINLYYEQLLSLSQTGIAYPLVNYVIHGSLILFIYS